MSPTITQIFVALVALIQILISIVEIFLWKHPKVHTRLDFDLTEAEKVYPIVMNAGFYNSFLAAGLIWGLTSTIEPSTIQLFFLSCVLLAGIFGAVTLKWTTLILQTLPSLIAIITTLYLKS
jgi:putative membrane protein